ncbi:MAG: type II secretion system minor pseudopilin GspK [Pseudomonadota bacterium]|nr:type II secretion system minor pseudopilin GspK [Pseudomonadota bacterium]
MRLRTGTVTIASTQRGLALITAMLVVALATLLAVNIFDRHYVFVQRTASVINGDQAWAYAEGAELQTRGLLRRDQAGSDRDTLLESWARPQPPLEIDGGTMEIRIEDLQGRFNLNNLVSGDRPVDVQIAYFQRLLRLLDLSPELVWPIVDWLDTNMQPVPLGAEDGDYLRLEPAYRTANRRFVSADELLLVRGMDRESYRRLAPFVTALPESTQLNVNTAKPINLRALREGLDEGWAQSVMAQQAADGFATVTDFLQLMGERPGPDQGEATTADLLGVRSQFFRMQAKVVLGESRLSMVSVLRRESDRVELIGRQREVFDDSTSVFTLAGK